MKKYMIAGILVLVFATITIGSGDTTNREQKPYNIEGTGTAILNNRNFAVWADYASKAGMVSMPRITIKEKIVTETAVDGLCPYFCPRCGERLKTTQFPKITNVYCVKCKTGFDIKEGG